MLSKNLDLIKNKPQLSTYFYYTKENPVNKPDNFIDQEQSVSWNVQTLSKPICLSKSDLCLELTGKDFPQDNNLLFFSCRGIIEGIFVSSGSGQKLMHLDRHVWAYGQIKSYYDSKNGSNQRGQIYEQGSPQPIFSRSQLQQSYRKSQLGTSFESECGYQISQSDSNAAGDRKLYIRMPLSTLGGIFSEQLGIFPLIDDLIRFDIKLTKKNFSFQYVSNLGVTSDVANQIKIDQIYLNIARSRDPEINAGLIQQINNGVQFPYPYISSKYDLANSQDTIQVNHSLTKNEGMKIKNIDTVFLASTANQSLVDISVDTNGPIDLTNFHKNPYGFVDLKIARNGILKEVMFNNELISSERPFLSSQNDKLDINHLLSKYHTHLSLSDLGNDELDCGVDMTNLPSTNYSLYHTFATSAQLQNAYVTTFIEGIQYLRQSSQNIQTQG